MPYCPVVTAQEMRRVEKLALFDGCSEEAFMQKAGRVVGQSALQWILLHNLPKKVTLLIGKGNKGGDGYGTGIFLREQGIAVRALALFPLQECSPLNQKLHTQFIALGGTVEFTPTNNTFEGDGLIIDALLGTGFKGKVELPLSLLITSANLSGVPILAIDVPSGLDATTGIVETVAIKATKTLTLGMFKSGLFLRDGWNHVGLVQCKNFDLPQEYFAKAKAIAQIPTQQTLQSYLPKIVRNRHKYEAGYVIGFSGSKIFRGAPKMAGMAALKAGAGIVRIFYKEDIGNSPDPLICQPWTKATWEKEKKRASAIFLGPGCGSTLSFLQKEISKITQPLVIDAEAIDQKITYPKQAILTPHRGEVLRLFGLKHAPSEEELIALCHKWVQRTHCILVLKGAPTWIFAHDTPAVIIPHGDPGMAKAGMGDVLTGIIAALLAQKAKPFQAAVLGVYLHALAGEKGAFKTTSYSLLPKDVMKALPQAILEILDHVIRLEPLHKAEDPLF